MAHIVVVGGGYAGTMALGRLRMQLPDARLTLVDPREASQARIHLHRAAVGQKAPHVAFADICGRWQVEHVRQRLVRVDGGTLVLESGSLTPDAVILALGSRTRPAPGPAHRLDDQASARALHVAMFPGARVTIVGSGTTALETATALAVRYPRASITLWGDLDGWQTSAKEQVRARLAELGIHVLTGGRVVGIDAQRCWSPEQALPHDLCVWCGGFEPVQVEGLGPFAPDGRLVVDPCLQWRSGWFVAGDQGCPPTLHRMGCVTALPMGAHAAANVVRFVQGEELEPFRFRDLVTCTDLGGGHGVVELLGSERVFGGRTGGMLKAGILGYVRTVLAAERSVGRPLYSWAKPRRVALSEVAGEHRS